MKLYRTLLSFIIFASLLSCEPNANVGRTVVLDVNGHQLNANQFAVELARRLKPFDALAVKDAGQLKRVKQDLVSDFILESLIQDGAKQMGVQVTEEVINRHLDEIRSGYPDDLAFRRALTEEDISLNQLRARLQISLTEELFFQELNKSIAAPTQKEIETFYASNKSRFMRKERVLLRQIVVDDIVKAEELRKVAPKKDFAKLANQYSLAPEAKTGGLVGWVERDSLDTFDKAFSMSAGGISQPLESPYGFHLFKVEKKAGAGAAALDEVRQRIDAEIRAQREQAAFLSWLDKQLRKSVVKKNAELIDHITVETRPTL